MRHHSPFPLPPEFTQVILGGGSAIDLDGLNIHTRHQAMDFAIHYGFDMELPAHRQHVVRVYEDALAFMRGVILEEADEPVPAIFLELEDPLNLLVWASERPRTTRAKWACALLRVMHTLFHIDNNVNLRFLPEIQRQVFGRYDRYLSQDSAGRWSLKGAYEVPLAAVERKENKDRTSVLLKLLHKPENVAETIYDQIGIRLVAEDVLGVLMIIRFLLDHHVLMPAHVKPSRSRNLMVDVEALKAWMESLPPGFQPEELSPEARRELCDRLKLSALANGANPFTSEDYSAIQFTARSLIRLPSPAIRSLRIVQRRLKDLDRAELADQVHIPELIQSEEAFTFFFAHEVQIMEQSGFQRAQTGPASHVEYKQRQREAARRRVLQGVF